MNSQARHWIEQLNLQPHPEGGWFRETYRSDEVVPASALPDRFGGERCFSTSIYFLLEGENISALHRIKSDEVWHFYDGASLTIHVIAPNGEYSEIRLGRNSDAGEALQAIVPAGCWFGADLEDKESYALVGCTVAPGFDFTDFEMADRDSLLKLYPRHMEIITRLSRNQEKLT